MQHLSALLLLCVLVAGCDSSGSGFDISDLLGTYNGARTIIEGDSRTTEDITFTVRANESAQTVELALAPEFGGEEVIRGTYDDDGIVVDFAQSGASFDFTVDRDGDIDGTFGAFGISGEVTGVLTPTRFDLTFASAGDENATRTEIRTSR